MKLEQIAGLLQSTSQERNKYFVDLISNNRNDTIRMNRDYYDGVHWLLDENNSSNTTRSKKKIWGTRRTNSNDQDVYQRAKGSGREVSFYKGQLQVKNYIKRFTQIYGDYVINSDSPDEIEVTVDTEDIQEENNQAVEAPETMEGEEMVVKSNDDVNEALEHFWKHIDDFYKKQVAKGQITTMYIARLEYDPVEGEYSYCIEDAEDIYPVYLKSKLVGGAKIYLIDKLEAKGYGVNCKDDQTTFAEFYYPDEQGNYVWLRMIDGVIVNESGEPEQLAEEMNFNPFSMISNIEHPNNKFDDNSLEDSEINDWIDKNDSLNAASTIEFLTNLHLASPKVSVNLQMMKDMNMSLQDQAIKNAIMNFQYSPYTIDTLPIEVKAGNVIPESFYTGMTNLKNQLLEDAGIPEFLITGQLSSNLATDTVELGLQMLVRKIGQKRDKITRQVKELSCKFLKAMGYGEYEQEDIEVNLPPIIGLGVKDVIQKLMENTQNGIFPKRYTAKEILKLMNREDDIEEVQQTENEDLIGMRQEIEQQKAIAQGEINAEIQIREQERQKQALQETEQRIQALS